MSRTRRHRGMHSQSVDTSRRERRYRCHCEHDDSEYCATRRRASGRARRWRGRRRTRFHTGTDRCELHGGRRVRLGRSVCAQGLRRQGRRSQGHEMWSSEDARRVSLRGEDLHAREERSSQERGARRLQTEFGMRVRSQSGKLRASYVEQHTDERSRVPVRPVELSVCANVAGRCRVYVPEGLQLAALERRRHQSRTFVVRSSPQARPRSSVQRWRARQRVQGRQVSDCRLEVLSLW